jgi:hypothetical protein
MRPFPPRVVVPVLIGLLLPLVSVSPQSIRGSVADAGGVPVPGVLIQLVGTDTVAVARTLTNELGQFFIVAPRAGTFRVRTLRIGFKPVLSEPVALTAGQEVPQQIALSGISLGLDTVRVGGRAVCGKTYDAGSMTVAIWEQARAAITSTAITGGMRNIFSRRVYYDQLLDNVGFRTVKETQSIETVPVVQPWPAESPANLHQFGYIVQVLDSTVYRAPGLEALASPSFFQDHCFKLANAKEKTQIAIEFDPTPDRRSIADIRGVVTLDRATAHLRSIEFRYVFPENKDLETGARGVVEFARLANGTWGISRWNIRMPILEMSRAGTVRSNRGVSSAEAQVSVKNVRSTGGELALAMLGPDTLFSRPPLVLNGTVADSATGRELAGLTVGLIGTQSMAQTDARGRFSLSGVLPGEYSLGVRTPGLDSLGTLSETSVSITDGKEAVRVRVPSSTQVVNAICGASRERTGIPGIVTGLLGMANGSAPPADTKVMIEWTDRATNTPRSAALDPGPQGDFKLCGVPVGTPVTLRAATGTMRAEPVTLTLAATQPVESVRMVLDVAAAAVATLTGSVVIDSGGGPIEAAEAVFPALGRTVSTNALGAFRITDLPPGTHQFVVRKAGFGPMETQLTLAPHEVAQRRIVLSRVQALPEVRVSAVPARLAEFEANRKLGAGIFYTREWLATQEGNTLSAVMLQTPGVWLWNAQDGTRRASVASNRTCRRVVQRGPGGGPAYYTCAPCFAEVWLDANRVSRPGDPFDINLIPVSEIEAIEYYRGSSEAPARYKTFDTGSCGIVVIHTRMSRKTP